jgi:outer membrane protein
MFAKSILALPLTALALASIAPASAQEAGEVTVQASVARTKLVDQGDIFVNGVQDPNAAYATREAYHSIVGVSWFPVDHVALDATLSTPATTNNIPAGSLAGTPNLGDDEFVIGTLGASLHPFKGRVRPYAGGGWAFQFTSQERDALARDLNIPNTNGPYLNAGIKVGVTGRLDIFADVRKAWYTTGASGRLPLDATYTTFANVTADAQLDPLTIQLGLGTRFGAADDQGGDVPPRESGDLVIKLGITNLVLADEIDLMVGGAPFPGAGLSTFEHQTASVQIAYYFTDTIAANATLGFPPTISIYGAGTIGALPMLGKATYGPTAFTLQWHPVTTGRVRPYVGVGGSYMITFDTQDGAFADLEVENDLGFAFEAGVDFPLDGRYSMFLDAKKALLRPRATGTFMGAPVVGQTRLDPWALTAGVSVKL